MPGDKTPRTGITRLSVAMRRAEAIKMRLAGVPIPEIMKLGYKSPAAVYQDISRGLVAFVGEPAAELRVIEVARFDQALVRLDEMEAKVREVRDREHITVNNGHVIYVPGPGGIEIPLLDDDPILRATAQLLGIEKQRGDVQTRRAKLLGLDAPTKVAVLTDELLDEELAKAEAAIADLERALAAEEAEPEGGEEAAG